MTGVFVGASEVNHQFDKSFMFERAAHSYIQTHLMPTTSVSTVMGTGGDVVSAPPAPPSSRPIHYFSALQPLWEVQIAWLFCRIPPSLHQPLPGQITGHQSSGASSSGAGSPGAERSATAAGQHPFLRSFISCNESEGLVEWCGRCDKCCFVFALLAAWMPSAEVAEAVFRG